MSKNMSNGTDLVSGRFFRFGPNLVRKKLTTTTTTTTSTTSTTTYMTTLLNDYQPTGLDSRVIVPGRPGVVFKTKAPRPIGEGVTYGENATHGVTSTLELCAPFPACDPIGCEDPTVAPIDCPDCNKAATNGTIFGMILLSLLIIAANLLVIRIILQTPSLRRRHGYIKLSMATSDLLVGLIVIPSAIANLITSLYYPYQTAEDVIKYGEMTFMEKAERVFKINTTASVVLGTIAVISVTSSLYNLLLLSADRFLAIARPLKHRAGRFSTKRSLWFSIAAVWIFGISLSVVPAFFPKYFWYQTDATTFFFMQAVGGNKTGTEVEHTFAPYYITIIIGGPYFATVVLNILTGVYTWKSLKVRRRLSSRSNPRKSAIERKHERNKRIQMLQEAYPEAVVDDESSSTSKFKRIFKGTPRHQITKSKRAVYANEDTIDEREKQSWLSWWRGDDNVAKFNCSNSNNYSTDSEGSQQPTQSPRFQRTRDQMQIVRDFVNPINARNKIKKLKANFKTHIRVFRMLISMVLAFSFCLLPYLIVALKFSDGSLDCHNVATPHTFAIYMLFLNSGMNFLIYNLWHPEFRNTLMKTFRRDYSKTTGFRRAASSFFYTSQKGTESSMTYATSATATSVDSIDGTV